MSTYGKQKTAAKSFLSEPNELKHIVLKTMKRVSDIVGSSLGPNGKLTLLESDYVGVPNRLTKDGVSIYKALAATNAYEHLIIETARDAATKTANEVGDGTTSATVLSYNLIKGIFDFCEKNPRYSPQKAVREIRKAVKEVLGPYLRSRAIKISEENKDLLHKVATISANGDTELADAVIQAFEEVGFGDSSHVTIREATGLDSYSVERIDGFPVPMGYEESIGKLHPAFINDQASLRCYMEKPLFLLYDGSLNDLIPIAPLLDQVGQEYVNGNSDFKNLVIVAHSFSESVLTTMAFNFANPSTINVIPLKTPLAQFLNSQTQFLMDLSAFTGAKLFGLKDQLSTVTLKDLGQGMESFECYRFRSTIVGNSDPLNIEVRADELKKMKEASESKAEKIWLDERIGKLTCGIAKLTVYGGSAGDIKERVDRVEDAVMACKSSIVHGVLPGGCRMSIDMALKIASLPDEGPAKEVLMSALLALPEKLLGNAGYDPEEIQQIIEKLVENQELVYDIANEAFGRPEELGLFDAAKAVEDGLVNAISIAGVLGCMGGIVAYPRDTVLEREEFHKDKEFMQAVDNPEQFKNEANDRA